MGGLKERNKAAEMIEQQQQQQRRPHRGGRRAVECCLSWLFLAMLVSNSKSSPASPLENKTETSTEKSESGVGLISPRMDYEEWTPLGRGDPLKNNPTFDYVPPVLDKVQYWLDSQATKGGAAKRDILVLGITAKKTSPKIPQRLFNLVDSNGQVDGQLMSAVKQNSKLTGQPSGTAGQFLQHRAEFTGSSGAELPHIRRASNFKHKFPSPLEEYSNEPGKTASYYSSRYYAAPQQRGKLHTTRLLSDTHQLNQESSPHSSYLPAFPSHVRLEKNASSSSQKGYGGSLNPAAFARDRGEPGRSNAVENIPGAVTRNFEGPKPPSTLDGRDRHKAASPSGVMVEKSSLIYESSHTLSGDWLEPQSTLVPKPTDSRIMPIQLLLPLSHHTDSNNHHHHQEYDGDHDVAPSANHPIIIPHNITIGITVPAYRPKMAYKDDNITIKEEGADYSSNDTGDRNSQQPALVLYPDPTTKDNMSSKESSNQHVTQSDQEPATQLVKSAASGGKMHIIIANSHSGEFRDGEKAGGKVEGGARTGASASLAIVMPTNYSNESWPTIQKNLHPTTATTAITSGEITTHWSQSVDHLVNLTANDPAHLFHSASLSDSRPDTPKRVLIAPPPPPPVVKESHLSAMPQYPRNHHQLVAVPPNPKAPPYLFTQQSELAPLAYPQRYTNLPPPPRPAPSSYPQPQPQSHSHAHLYLLQQRPQLVLESVKDRGPSPETSSFSKGAPHSAFNPQSAASAMSSSAHMPGKVRQPLAAMLMSMPVELRVSMSMPMHGAALSPPLPSPTPADHTVHGSIPSRTISIQDQAATKEASVDQATFHTRRIPAGLALSATGALAPEMPSVTRDQTTLNPARAKPAAPDLTAEYATAVGSSTRSKISPTRPMLNDNAGSIDESRIASGAAGAGNEELPKKEPLVTLLVEEKDSGAMGGRGRQEVCTPATNKKQTQSSMSALAATAATTDQDELMPGSGPTQVHPKTTTVASLTTDPIFSHYKQPARPIRGPMYLIIQGHSKVKTYKPNLNEHSALLGARHQLQERGGNTEDLADKQFSKFDRYVRVRENAIKDERDATNSTRHEKGASGGEARKTEKYMGQHTGTLMSLIESGLGEIISASPLPVVSTRKVRSSVAMIPSPKPKPKPNLNSLGAGVHIKEMSECKSPAGHG